MRCGFFEGCARGEILPKKGEKSRHQPVFFYARAEAETPQSSALANGICVENAKTHNAFPHKYLPASAKGLPALSADARAAKSTSVKEGLEQEKTYADAYPA